jgi:DNA-directed RNA polymerase
VVAKRIADSASKRKIKEEERRAVVRAAMGDSIDSSLSPQTDPTTANPETASSLLEAIPSNAALAQAEASIMGPASEETLVESEAEVESAEDGDVGLSQDDLDLVARMVGGGNVPEERIGAHKFVKFADILPPTPPRGVFDVSKVGGSAYFFS